MSEFSPKLGSPKSINDRRRSKAYFMSDLRRYSTSSARDGSMESLQENYIEEDIQSSNQVIIRQRRDFRTIIAKLWSVRCLVIILFTSGILITGILIWLVGFLTAQQGVNSLANRAQSYLSDDIERFTQDYNSLQPLALATILDMMIMADPTGGTSNILNLTNQALVRSMLLSVVKENADLSTVLYANTLGDTLTVRNVSSYYAVGICNHTNGMYNFYSADPVTGLPGQFIPSLSSASYTPKTRPWYIAGANSTGGKVWAPIFINLSNPPQLVLSNVAPYYYGSQLLGILSSQSSLTKISTFLARQGVITGADIFIMEQTTALIATSIGNPFTVNGSSVSRLLATQSTYYVFADATKYLLSVFGTLYSITGVYTSTFVDSQGNTRLILADLVQDSYGLSWITVAVLSYSSVMGAVTNGVYIAAAVSAVAVVISAIAAIGFGFGISVPLEAMALEMEYVANMDLNERPSRTLHLSEFNKILSSMNQMKQGLTNFQKFVPSDVVRKLLSSNATVQLGVKKRSLTLLFMDIKDFTTITESISPNMLISLMSKFFTRMSQAIMDNGGTIDKFIGDCIMAMWNAPELLLNHEICALDAVFQMQKELVILNKKWAKKRYPEIIVRVGVNTSPALVGNIGSPNRMNYTALGDGVNVAARLESLNKHWGTKILIGENTYEAVKSHYVCRWIDYVSLKGKNNPINVYEALGPTSSVSQDILDTCASHDDLKRTLHSIDFESVKKKCLMMLELNSDNIAVERLYERLNVHDPPLVCVLSDK